MATPIEQIKERLSILDVIGQYVELKAAGKSYKGKSPFTNEKTPSFYVSPDRGVYFCFSSQKGGDMFTFVQEMEGVDFKGALKILAERAHVELVQEDPQKRDAREMQYALLEAATEYFFRERDAHPHVNEYIGARGVKAQTVHAWRIGYARDEWRALRHHLKEKGFSDDEMLRAGLIKKADAGKEPYDVFRDRVMFPIMDTSGRVVAFSGRTLKSEPGIPKYVNSPETELYQKSEILYGYDKAKHGIRHYDFSLVVEGQFDLVMAHQAGYVNTVAVSGTALTPHHTMLLLRLSKNVVLSLDADRAGISAMKRVALPMLRSGMDVKVAHMPDGQDPADVIRRDSGEFKRIVGDAVHVVEFLLSVLRFHTKDERTYKLRVREEILPLLVAIDNRIDREHFEGVIAERIGATKEGIHFEVERIAETVGHEHGASDESVDARINLKTSNRRVALEGRLRALVAALTHDRTWIGDQVTAHVKRILSDDEYAAFVQNGESAAHGETFVLEEYIETIREKQLLEEVEDTLTQFARLVARDRLARTREAVTDAESRHEDDRVHALLTEAKQIETLIKTPIVIGREEI